MKRTVVVSVMFLVAVSLFINFVPTVCCQSENVQVLGYSWYISSLNTFVVVGEVQNVGSNNIEFIALSGLLTSTDGEDETWSTTTVYANEILPQQKAPFVMYFFSDYSISGSFSWNSADLNAVEFDVIVSNATEKYQYPNLEIENSQSKIETDGNFTVTGTVTNTGTEAAGRLWVVATFYNATGSVIATGFSDYLTPDYLEAGQSTGFTVNTVDAIPELVNEMQALAYKITDYSLYIQTEAPIIPEFPLLPILFLFATATLVVIVFNKKQSKSSSS